MSEVERVIEPSDRKPYRAPRLREYGAVRFLTSGGSGLTPEGGQGKPANMHP